MKNIIRLGSILMLTTAVAAVGLAAVYSVTKPRIEEQKRLAVENALTLALPMVEKDAIVAAGDQSDIQYYKAYDSAEKDTLVGYAYIARGAGYSSTIETMVGIDSSGRIVGLKVLDQKETPGLGTKIEEVKYGESDPWFTRQFITKPAATVQLEKDGGSIDSITGATISSRAMTNSIAEGYRELQQVVKNQQN
jgi:electron transport complex protein RnfG